MRSNTKEKIVKAALLEFAAQGYEQTATRDILSKANANVAAISYYFGHKKGLYIEILTRIAKRIADAFQDLLPAYAAMKKKKATPKECEDLLKKFIRVFVEVTLRSWLSVSVKTAAQDFQLVSTLAIALSFTSPPRSWM